MLKSMLIDLKQECKLCGSPVGIYLLNPEEGLKMCSDPVCEWPFAEDALEIFDMRNVNLYGINLKGPCPSVDLNQLKSVSRRTGKLVSSVASDSSSISRSRGSDKDIACLADLDEFKEPDKDVFLKPAPVDVNEHIQRSLKRARAHLATTKAKTEIKQPWMLRQLQINKVLHKKANFSDIKRESATQYKMNIDTDSESGPVIKIQVLAETNKPAEQTAANGTAAPTECGKSKSSADAPSTVSNGSNESIPSASALLNPNTTHEERSESKPSADAPSIIGNERNGYILSASALLNPNTTHNERSEYKSSADAPSRTTNQNECNGPKSSTNVSLDPNTTTGEE